MESNLFDFESCDGDVVLMQYFNVTLNQDLGKFPKGTTFPRVVLDAEAGYLTLYEGSIVAKFHVGLVVTSTNLLEQ